MREIKPGMIVMIQSHCGGFMHVGEVVSFPDASQGQTLVRIVPGMAGSARWVDTKRLFRPDLDRWNEHFDDWSD